MTGTGEVLHSRDSAQAPTHSLLWFRRSSGRVILKSMTSLLGTSFHTRRIVHRHDLLASGISAKQITQAVRVNELLRVRRDHYALPGTDRHTLEAVRIGGRKGCVSAAEEMGIFALDTRFTHVHIDRAGSRLRSPHSRFIPLAALPRDGVHLHWSPLIDQADGSEYCVGPRDALAQIIRCQKPPFALAALDTALHQQIIRTDDLDDIFARVPCAAQILRSRVDARVDAGQETVLREIIRAGGFRCTIQVQIDGVGRVDTVVEGCVIVEADSFAHHSSWESQVRDRERDRRAALNGYVTLRLLYADIMFDPRGVIDAIRHLVEICRHGSIRATP